VKEAKLCRYVLVTPARDEAAYIRKTVESVVAQTVLPLRWVIVSDGSTDGTDEIVNEYASKHAWIRLMRMPERRERHFAGKVGAFNAGYDTVKGLDFEVIGNLDGDTSFEPDYIEYLLGQFSQNPRLGVGGTNYIEDSWDSSLKHDYRFSNIEDVTGQCQLFRRTCFDAIGGYQPSKIGGVDLIATISARMHGWQTRVYTGRILHHHRQQGTAQFHKYTVEFSNGRKDYLFGSHPLWATCRATYRLTKKPVILGGCLLLAGYFWALLTRSGITVPRQLVEFRRKEQMVRLIGILRNMISSTSSSGRESLAPKKV
jgi:biofilm PGA synthesis N-glycosyltransferase PgaC